MDSNAFLNDLMSKMKLPEAKGKKKAEQSESVAQILAAMQKVKTEKKKPPVTSYAPTKEMPVNELESMEEFSQLASDVMQECRPAIPAVKTSISEKTVRVAAYIRVSSTKPLCFPLPFFHRNILESTGLMTPVRKWSVTAYLRAISSLA